jgi:hypothetical protein
MPTAAEQLISVLTLTLRQHAPTVVSDMDEQGRDILLLTIRNPNDERWSLQFLCPNDAQAQRALRGTLWFGAVKITDYLSAEEACGTIQAVLDGNVTAVLRYRDGEALSDHHPSGLQKVFLTAPAGGDDAALAALRAHLQSPVTLRDRLGGTYIGIFELANWQNSEIIHHLPKKKERNRA